MDIYLGPDNIVGIFKHLPGSSFPSYITNNGLEATWTHTGTAESEDSCYYGPEGGGHGFLWIPKGVTVAAGTGAAQDIWDFIDRNFVPYEGDYQGVTGTALLNAFLNRTSSTATGDEAIGMTTFDKGAGAVADSNYGRLLHMGVMYAENLNMKVGGRTGGSNSTSILYMGRGNWALGDSVGPADAEFSFQPKSSDNALLAYRQFPCQDVLGGMAPGDLVLGSPGTRERS